MFCGVLSVVVSNIYPFGKMEMLMGGATCQSSYPVSEAARAPDSPKYFDKVRAIAVKL